VHVAEVGRRCRAGEGSGAGVDAQGQELPVFVAELQVAPGGIDGESAHDTVERLGGDAFDTAIGGDGEDDDLGRLPVGRLNETSVGRDVNVAAPVVLFVL
jgi:hypothetical protein